MPTMENDFWLAVGLALLAGLSIPMGGWLAMLPGLMPQWFEQPFRHWVVAFGGGALLAAVALVLLPEGIAALPTWGAILAFVLGGVVFCFCDAWIGRSGKAMGQFLAMLLDFVPEAIALGAAFAHGEGTGVLLAFLIAIQNLPEGFNASREMLAADHGHHHHILWAFVACAAAGPIAAWVGWSFLADLPVVLGVIMVFCSGGILYLCFQDIAPQARQEHHWLPPLGAVAGFTLGLLGHMLIQP